ncbi:DNA transformation protein [Bibersteinia trehalosi USDA-ARS-USMARC-188]|uniref:DNA transformation protein n=3 Tax=Bibersteinia trehalosi TaxID=47735 RepID=A0A4V7ICE2_BIBTR|nr:TfoX/Sxy family protein [Bibersteinia trehalosi]AGH37522.1 DNA transformation protein [Bibersteinia trehalosi USDA-ARS-USMARC-192]AHG82669.1 DNA transformation protein [Bibersteinia trehalosi USDA-ARS-USMARC-188]AHG85005.1 DNA transformation protein [Bibersteinia trehalosi USDA-ARS-USMARC-189]OAQ13813.1 DNA transformation protein [Bibersteinia trehalosi Y31]TCT13040.1 regulator of competence-specific genes [Bibersteinia trehalosi]
MSSIYKKTRLIREIFADIIGETRVKTFFSYYAIFKNDLLFGLYKNDKFYLRMPEHASENELISQLERLDDARFGIHNKNFYHLPQSILLNPEVYSHLVKTTLKEIALQKKLSSLKRRELIRALPNLNINIERILKKLGICSINDFMARGAYSIYVELIKSGIEADETFLFKLYGAIHRQYIYTMTPEQKRKILKDANQALYEAGLRKRFKIDD